MDNILLVDTKTIRSIPKQSVGDIASRDVISFTMDCSVKDACKKLADNDIDGAPVIKDGKVVGVFTLTDLVHAIAEDREKLTVGELMSTNVVIVNEDLKIANAIEVMLKKSISRLIVADNNQVLLGIVTRTDLINTITNLDQFPIITN
jgi:predicted transcriptional regulator